MKKLILSLLVSIIFAGAVYAVPLGQGKGDVFPIGINSSGYATIEGTLTVEGSSTFKTAFIQDDIYSAAWADYGATSTIVGWTSFSYKYIYYHKFGKLCYVNVSIRGTSDSATTSFTLPYAAKNSTGNNARIPVIAIDNNITQLTWGYAYTTPNSAVVTCFKNISAEAWTASGVKEIGLTFLYETQ